MSHASVYSDKQISGVVNTRVQFTDGSWCDTDTRKIVCRGEGYISFDSLPDEATGESVSISHTYSAHTLIVQGVSAGVTVLPHDGSEMIVTIEGKKQAVENVVLSCKDRTLNISGKGGNSYSGSMMSNNYSGGNMVMSGSFNVVQQSSASDAQNPRVRIEIKVPVGSDVKTSGVQGKITVGNIDGNFTGVVQSDDNMIVGNVRSASLTVQGSGDVKVSSVSGWLEAVVQGSGDITVDNLKGGDLTATVQGGGDITLLQGVTPTVTAQIMGGGDITFGGSADSAELSIMGSGDISVKYVKNRPSKSRTGKGDITVGNW